MRFVTCLAALALLAAAPALADELTVINGTDGEVASLFVSDLGGAKWGDDLLDEPLAPGASVTAKDLQPGPHRVRIIDEDDAECIIDNVDVQGRTTWTLTDEALDECQTPEDGQGALLAPHGRAAAATPKVAGRRTGQGQRFSLE
jgi:hypothetical protein